MVHSGFNLMISDVIKLKIECFPLFLVSYPSCKNWGGKVIYFFREKIVLIVLHMERQYKGVERKGTGQCVYQSSS